MTHLLRLKYPDNSEKKWNLLLEYYAIYIFITYKYSFHPIIFYMPHDMPAYLSRVLAMCSIVHVRFLMKKNKIRSI